MFCRTESGLVSLEFEEDTPAGDINPTLFFRWEHDSQPIGLSSACYPPGSGSSTSLPAWFPRKPPGAARSGLLVVSSSRSLLRRWINFQFKVSCSSPVPVMTLGSLGGRAGVLQHILASRVFDLLICSVFLFSELVSHPLPWPHLRLLHPNIFTNTPSISERLMPMHLPKAFYPSSWLFKDSPQ